MHTVHQGRWRLAFETAPSLLAEQAVDLGKRRQRRQKRMEETEADRAVLGDQLQGAIIGVGDFHLAVADHPVAAELKPRNAETGDAHASLAQVLSTSVFF